MIRRKTMASKPLCRLAPSPRSFAADAHDCITVTILPDRPNPTAQEVPVTEMAAATLRWRPSMT